MAEASIRTLTVGTDDGLCNRLRALLSGMVLAEATGRRFTMLWPRTPACSAAFTDLFASPWPVREVAAQEVKILRRTFGHWHPAQGPDLLTADGEALRFSSYSWLLVPHRFPAHESLMQRYEELLAAMRPASDIQERMDALHRDAFCSRVARFSMRR